MADSTIWWLLAGGAVALELVTGTFYLLMMAIALATGALAAHLGLALPWQLTLCAFVGVAAVLAWRQRQRRQAQDSTVRNLRSVNLDIGEVLQIDQWAPDGSAQVKYRGAQWTAQLARPSADATGGAFRVVELRGNRLIVEKV